MNSLILIIFAFVLLVVIGLVALMAVYVAKDAKVHDMNPILWVLVVIFVPNFLGLVIYLIVRSSYEKKSACFQCGKLVENDYSVCPFCKAELNMHCLACDKVLSPEWHSCPHCGQEVDATQVTRAPKKDKGLKAIVILVIVVAVPILLCILLFFGLFAFRTGSSVSSRVTSMEMMAVENNFGREFDFSAMRFSGQKVDELNVKKDGMIAIESSLNYESGNVKATLCNGQQEVLYEFKLNGEDIYQMNVIEGERYTILIDGKNVENIKLHFTWDYIE